MPAIVIPITRRPAPRPTEKTDQYAFIRDYAKVWFAMERAKEQNVSPADVYVSPEQEILKLLRRIDRKLGTISTARIGGASC